MAKAKTQPAKKDETVKRSSTRSKAKPTPQPSDIEKTISFTEVFVNDARSLAQAFVEDKEVISMDESDAGDAGTTGTVIYK